MKKFFMMLLLALTGVIVSAETAEEIIRRADTIFTFNNVYSVSEMTVYRKDKAQPTQVMEGYSSRKSEIERSLTLYSAPARVKGTAYLAIEDDLWVRFASTGRVRKLSSSAKKNSAGGSDFSYDDIGSGNTGYTKDYSAKIMGEERVEGHKCHRIELKPLQGVEAPYEKLAVYVEKEGYRYLKIDYYENGAIIKTLILDDFRPLGDHDYPYRIVMQSHIQQSRTEVITVVMEVDSPRVEDRMFSTAWLDTIR
jgi:hypothetical protein